MADDYSEYFEEEEKKSSLFSNLFPLGTIFNTAKAVDEEVEDYSEYFSDLIPDSVKQGASVVGSGLSAVIEPLDKLRGTVEGGRRALFETPSVMDDRGLGERVMSGAVEGFKEPEFPDVGQYYPDAVKDFEVGGVNVGAVPPFLSNLGASIAEDPLTYTPTAVVTVPFRVAKGIMKAVAGTKPVKSVLQSGPVTNVLESLNLYTGDAAKVQKLINDVRLESRGEEILSERQMFDTNEELRGIAENAGVTISALKQAILEASETTDLSKISKMGVDAVKFAQSEIKFYQDMLAVEKSAGLGTADITKRGLELGVKGYAPHIRNETFTAKIKRLLSTKSGFMQERGIAGTIDEINTARGTGFFMDDFVQLGAMRQRWHNQVMLADRSLNKAAQKWGTMVGKAPEGSLTKVDIDGSPIPPDWKVIKDHAYPPEVHRILSKQYELMKSPSMAKGFWKGFDEVQNWWKKYSLASRPAWHTRNAFGNFWNNYMIGGLTDFRLYGEAAAIQKAMHVNKGGIVSRLDKLTKADRLNAQEVVKGTGMTREEIFNEAIKRGVYESGLYGQDLGEAALKSSNTPFSTEWKGINKAFAAGKAVENNARIALFIDGIKKAKKGVKGGPVDMERILDGSATNVRKSLFDYSDLSEFEKQKMKRLMPFYTWTRKNIPAQMRAIAEHPDRANKINILVGNLQKGVGTIDETDIEQWVKGQFPIFLKSEDSEAYYTFMTAMSYLPTAELDRLMRSPEQLGKMMGDMTTPLFKLPVELIFNYGAFKEDKIDSSQLGVGIGKFGEGMFSSLPGKTGSQDFLGLKVTPKQKHLLQALVLLGEVDRLNPWNVFGESETGEKSWAGTTRHGQDILESSRWIRAIIGARIYKREKGRAKMGAVTDLMKDMKYLEREIGGSKSMNNPDLRSHLMRMFKEILP